VLPLAVGEALWTPSSGGNADNRPFGSARRVLDHLLVMNIGYCADDFDYVRNDSDPLWVPTHHI
jgi:hypothetical protein